MRRSIFFAFGWLILWTAEGAARAQNNLPARYQLLTGSDQDSAWGAFLAGVEDLRERGRYEAAYDLALKALREAEQFGFEDFRVAVTLNQLGLLCNFLSRYSEAEAVYLRAVRIIEHDAEHRLVFTQVLHNLSSLYMQNDARYSQAERLLRRAIEVGTTLLGADHPDVGAMLANLASARMMQRHDSEAQVLFERALGILEKSPPSHQPNVASVLSNLGCLTFRQGDHIHALAYMIRSIAVYEQSLGTNHPELVSPLLNLGRIHLALNHSALAEEPLQRAAAIAASALGAEHPILGEVLSTYAVVLRKNGKKKEGRQMEARAKGIRTVNPGRVENATIHVADLLRQ